LIDRAHTATFASELSAERQQKFVELLHWVDGHRGGSSFLRLWCASGLMELGRFDEARPLLLDLGERPLRLPYPFPLSRILDEVAPGGELSIDTVGDLNARPEGLSDRVGLEALLAGMTLAKPQLFPPFPFGTQVANGAKYRDKLVAENDTEVLNALHVAYCRAFADTLNDPALAADNWLSSIDALAARRMMHAAGDLSEQQRWALSAVQSKVGEGRGRLSRLMQGADDIELPGVDTAGMDFDEIYDLATSSIYGYLRNYVVAAHKADSMGNLQDDAQDLQRFDYTTSHWKLKVATVKQLGRRNNSSIKYGADDMLRYDYDARTWGVSKRRLLRISRRTEFSIGNRAGTLREAAEEE
jgi:hypothetical protein